MTDPKAAMNLWKQTKDALLRSDKTFEYYTGHIGTIQEDGIPGVLKLVGLDVSDLSEFRDLQTDFDQDIGRVYAVLSDFKRVGEPLSKRAGSGARLSRLKERLSRNALYAPGDVLEVGLSEYQLERMVELAGSNPALYEEKRTGLIHRVISGFARRDREYRDVTGRASDIVAAALDQIKTAFINSIPDESGRLKKPAQIRAEDILADVMQDWEEVSPSEFMEASRLLHRIMSAMDQKYFYGDRWFDIRLGRTATEDEVSVFATITRLLRNAGKAWNWAAGFISRAPRQKAVYDKLDKAARAVAELASEDPALEKALNTTGIPMLFSNQAEAARSEMVAPGYVHAVRVMLQDADPDHQYDREIRFLIQALLDLNALVTPSHPMAMQQMHPEDGGTDELTQIRDIVDHLNYTEGASTYQAGVLEYHKQAARGKFEHLGSGVFNDVFEMNGKYVIRVSRFHQAKDQFEDPELIRGAVVSTEDTGLTPRVLYFGQMRDGRSVQIIEKLPMTLRKSKQEDSPYGMVKVVGALERFAQRAVSLGISLEDAHTDNFMIKETAGDIDIVFSDIDGLQRNGTSPGAQLQVALHLREQLLDPRKHNSWGRSDLVLGRPLLRRLNLMIGSYQADHLAEIIRNELDAMEVPESIRAHDAIAEALRFIPEESYEEGYDWENSFKRYTGSPASPGPLLREDIAEAHLHRLSRIKDLIESDPGSEATARIAQLLVLRSQWVQAILLTHRQYESEWGDTSLDGLIDDYENYRDLPLPGLLEPFKRISGMQWIQALTTEAAILWPTWEALGRWEGIFNLVQDHPWLALIAGVSTAVTATTGFMAGAGLLRRSSDRVTDAQGARMSHATAQATFENRAATGRELIGAYLRPGGRVLTIGTGMLPYAAQELADRYPRNSIDAVERDPADTILVVGDKLRQTLLAKYALLRRLADETSFTGMKAVYRNGQVVTIEAFENHLTEAQVRQYYAQDRSAIEEYLALQAELKDLLQGRSPDDLTASEREGLVAGWDPDGNAWIDRPFESPRFSRPNLHLIPADILDPESIVGTEAQLQPNSYRVIEDSNLFWAHFTKEEKAAALRHYEALLEEGGILMLGRSSNDHYVKSSADGERTGEYLIFVKKKGVLTAVSFTFNVSPYAVAAFGSPGAMNTSLIGAASSNSMFDQDLKSNAEPGGLLGAYQKAVVRAGDARPRGSERLPYIEQLLKSGRFYDKVAEAMRALGYRTRVEHRRRTVSLLGMRIRWPWGGIAIGLTTEFDGEAFLEGATDRIIKWDAHGAIRPEASVREVFEGWTITQIEDIKQGYDVEDPARVFKIRMEDESGGQRTVYLKVVAPTDAQSDAAHQEAWGMVEREAGIYGDLEQAAGTGEAADAADPKQADVRQALAILPKHLWSGLADADWGADVKVDRPKSDTPSDTKDLSLKESIDLKPGSFVLITEGITNESLTQILNDWSARAGIANEEQLQLLKSEVRTVFASVIQSLRRAHGAGLYNRDLTMSDTFWGRASGAQIGDWGAGAFMASEAYGLNDVIRRMYEQGEDGVAMLAIANAWNYGINRYGMNADTGEGWMLASDMMSVISMYREALIMTGDVESSFGEAPADWVIEQYLFQEPDGLSKQRILDLLEPHQAKLHTATFGSFGAVARMIEHSIRDSGKTWQGHLSQFPAHFSDYVRAQGSASSSMDPNQIEVPFQVPVSVLESGGEVRSAVAKIEDLIRQTLKKAETLRQDFRNLTGLSVRGSILSKGYL
ncbi:MAG: hypothetical protein KBD07_04675, partial [Candidatus Omnitrophica bacterium]|nr:hypothetical protein [Candidatus Omnitrophota bacterium]